LAPDGKTRLDNPPLALDLHYLLTAYGYYDWQAEALLGYALLQLHQYPVIARSDIAVALSSVTSSGLPSLATALASCGLADQIEMIKITPATLGREEMAWLWTALKADYRPTFPFKVSVVLMEEPAQVTFALPVIERNIQAQVMSAAELLSIQLPNHQPAALPGDTISVTGQFLKGAVTAVLVQQHLGVEQTVDLTVPPAVVTNTKVSFPLPTNPTMFPAGIYNLSLRFANPSNPGFPGQSTNSLSIPIAPSFSSVTGFANLVNPGSVPGTLVTVTFGADVWPSQTVTLTLNDLATGNSYSAPAQHIATASNSVNFQFVPPLPHIPLLVIVEVDEVASLIQYQTTPPTFTGPMVTI
jgi:Pvc16 N-terminal domain